MALCGLGFGFFQAPNNRTLLTSAPMDRSGAAGGMLATARLTGQTIGATIAALCLRATIQSGAVGLTIAAVLAALAALASLSRVFGREGLRPARPGVMHADE
jgi:DHA2 family multidrug resistance protein-like MFS transporter